MNQHVRAVTLLLLLAAPCATHTLQAQAKADTPESPRIAISDEVLGHIPSPYREEMASLHLKASAEDQQKLLAAAAVQPDAPLAMALKAMSVSPQGFDFMIQELGQETSATRRSMILKFGIQPQVRRAREGEQRDRVGTVLTKLALEDPDAGVSLEALAALRRLQWGHVSELTVRRAAIARKANDEAGAMRLLNEGDRWLEWDDQVNLPNFMRTPPPVFSVAPEGRAIHALAFGDFGTSSPQQLQLAGVMRQYETRKPFDFGLTLGDNFYPIGVNSPDDPQWKAKFEDVYNPLGIQFYATLGNHDYIQADGPAAEIVHAQRSKSWRMPASYYTYTAGPVQFFAIDTIELSDSALPNKEIAWLNAELAKSKAKWKVVYGHYQIYSATRGDEQNLIQRLLPVLRNRADVYLCGHDHNLQELKPEDGVHFFVSGGGGAGTYAFRQPNYAHNDQFKDMDYGFTILDATDTELKMTFIGLQGQELYSSVIRK
ncbi:MAG TPA: metallophosphoesterase [Acidobacteriaceae bacterium]